MKNVPITACASVVGPNVMPVHMAAMMRIMSDAPYTAEDGGVRCEVRSPH